MVREPLRGTETITTSSVPPPPRAHRISSSPSVAPADLPSRPSGEEPKPRRAIDWRIAVAGAVSGAAIGVALLLATRDRSRPQPPRLVEPAPLEARPMTSTITIDVAPANATITLGDLPPHTGSPWTVELAPGSYAITVTARDHEPWSATLDVTAERSQLVRAALAVERPVASASLALDSIPPGLDVAIDGVTLPNQTPIRTGIPPGRHEIVVRDRGTAVWSTTFVAKDNHTHRFSVKESESDPVAEPPIAPRDPPAGDLVEHRPP
jgi:hypothetical protein